MPIQEYSALTLIVGKERLQTLQHQASKSLEPHPADVFELNHIS